MLAGQNINSQMISTGRAWHYKKYSKSPALASLEFLRPCQQARPLEHPHPSCTLDFSESGNGPQIPPDSLAIPQMANVET
jgi:hypothetical protein